MVIERLLGQFVLLIWPWDGSDDLEHLFVWAL